MRVFITASFEGGKNKKEVEYLCSLVKKSGFEDFSFFRDVENYQKVFDNPKDLMAKAKEEILKSDILLIDMTEKPTGRAIEAGIAFAQNKRIVAIMKKGTKIKDTTVGISDLLIEYEKLEDIVTPLSAFYDTLKEDI